ncbi:Pimeloyl-ACP methyl ester carboxylesterase [Natronoarchaeum philippinense]|uniref:Pimeloyl-ACP methyl ester carboxylesterase n=1 Tax=Natronoarchaeum philippinense TaxID=558529 RepID=A0A285NBM3_NATPI|nr:alpha/beta hydrolase [Natronoarchaeum philippinense]SNZ06865.1 Pimeloyl-ACP methyl ester carboxylesterase [Natronoarchaeum philippinense]
MPVATNDGVDIYYEVDGPSNAETVVLIEGLGYGRWMWRWQREALAEHYETIVVDNRGTGESDAPAGPYSIAEMAADVEAVLADRGVERAHLIGASMGGMIVQQYAIEYDRAASIALLCSSLGGEEAPAASPEVQARMVAEPEGHDEREVIRHRMAPAMTDEFPERNDDLIERIVDWRLTQDADDAARESQLAAVGAFDAADRLGEIDAPALVAHGTADRVLPVENAELLADGLSDARLELFDGGPHLFFIEQADAVNETLLDFLGEQAAGRHGGDGDR